MFERDAEGAWRVSCLIHYSNAMFTADFLIKETGMCDMIDDMPVMADLPIKIDAPIS